MKKLLLLILFGMHMPSSAHVITDIFSRAQSMAEARAQVVIEERYADVLQALCLGAFGKGLVFGFIAGARINSLGSVLGAVSGNTVTAFLETICANKAIARYGDFDDNNAFLFLQSRLPKHTLSYLPQLKTLYISEHHLYSNIAGFIAGVTLGGGVKALSAAIRAVAGHRS